MSKRAAAILTIIISIFAIITIIAASSGAVMAWFRSTLSSRKNVFTSGTVMIKCNESLTAGMTEISNIYPGWNAIGNIRVENSGTLDLQYRMYIDTSGLAGNPLFDGEQPLNISIMKGDSILKDYTTLNNFGVLNMGPIKKGGYDNLIVFLKLPEDAGNSCQEKSMGLNFIFEAKQEGSNSAYPGEKLVSSITITSDDGTFSVSPGKPLNLSVQVEPEDASRKDVIWSVQPVTGYASVDQSGLIKAVSNGSVEVMASAADSSGVFGKVVVDVQGVVLANTRDALKAAMQNPSVKTIDVSSMVYNIEDGVLRDDSAQDVTITCSKGEAIVNIIKKDGTAYGHLPKNIKAGVGITINEDVILIRKLGSIQTVVDNAPPNSIIAFEGGLFKDGKAISINKPLTLLGIQSCFRGFKYSDGTASIRTSPGSEIIGVEITGKGISNTTIMGLDFTGAPVTVTGDSSNIKIVNNVFKSFASGGINFSGSCSSITIQGNAISGWEGSDTAAINIAGTLNNDISINNNYICQGCSTGLSSTGIKLSGGSNIQVNNNIIKNTTVAGILFSGNGYTIECWGNIINKAQCGIQFVYGSPMGIRGISISNNSICQPNYCGIQVTPDGISVGAVRDINIYCNEITRDIGLVEYLSAYRSVCIQLGKEAVQHGTINVLNNNFKICGTCNSVKDTCCLLLSGKLNTVNIIGNVFQDESNCPTPDSISGIHIVKNDLTYGPIPEDAVITDNLELINNFDIFHGIPVLDERKR